MTQIHDLNFRLGCAIWAYRGWLGELYPERSPSANFLHLYGQRFWSVEGNTTFYAIPAVSTVQRWAAETPRGFEFCPKFPKTVTHQGTLLPQLEGAIAFLDLMRHLGDRLGPVFAQLPPNYGPQALNDLQQFLQALTVRDGARDVDLAVEVRHPDWFKPAHYLRLTTMLQHLGVGLVLLDSRPIYQTKSDNEDHRPFDPQLILGNRKPQVPLQPALTAPFSIVRYISHPTWEQNLDFLNTWVPILQQWLALGTRVYWFVHCPIEARSPGNARRLQAWLETQGVLIPPLPWNLLPPTEPPPTQQLRLF